MAIDSEVRLFLGKQKINLSVQLPVSFLSGGPRRCFELSLLSKWVYIAYWQRTCGYLLVVSRVRSLKDRMPPLSCRLLRGGSLAQHLWRVLQEVGGTF